MPANSSSQPHPLFVLIGGFLGAGKTTAISVLAREFEKLGKRCAIVTNDQGLGLVDTAMARTERRPVTEISGGCFCCRLEDLLRAVEQMSQEHRPEVFLAEPVGSCTDLAATVLLPLKQIYQAPLRPAPLSVMLDGRKAYDRYVSKRRGRDFAKDVTYISQKQMEEAEILVLNKVDLLSEKQIAELTKQLETKFPDRTILHLSAKGEVGFEAWMTHLLGPPGRPRGLRDIDYARYGRGEAELGWLNVSGTLDQELSRDEVEAVLQRLFTKILQQLHTGGHLVAHLKVAIEDPGGGLLRVQATHGEDRFETVGSLPSIVRAGRLLLNLRAQGDPEPLRVLVAQALEETLHGVAHSLTAFASFKPGEPRPTHRVAPDQN